LKRNRILILAIACLTATIAVLFGGVLDSSASKRPSAAAAQADANGVASGFGADTPALVVQLQNALRAQPNSVRGLDLLGLAYQQRARETGDPTYYSKSEGVLRRALRLAPNDLIATSGLGSLALSRHRFREALALGLRARSLAPAIARNYGVIGDALVELGRYRAAFHAFDHMAKLVPSLDSYSRISYARELRGDFPDAVAAMKLALDAAIGEPEAIAWTHVQLGKLYWSRGRVDAAAREDELALRAFHGYPSALDALALAEAAQGQVGPAIAHAQRAVDAIPLPQYVTDLGDLLRTAGRRAEARKQYELIGVIRRLLAANGVQTDLETALFDVDHGIDLSASLALARKAEAERPSIDGDDVLAWALFRSGRCGDALTWSRRALRLGTQDALKFFHRGAIERCLGHATASRTWLRRALALNPHFSLLWAPVARAWLS
jgi:tetratricopeptide (TPR) repeat protein